MELLKMSQSHIMFYPFLILICVAGVIEVVQAEPIKNQNVHVANSTQWEGCGPGFCNYDPTIFCEKTTTGGLCSGICSIYCDKEGDWYQYDPQFCSSNCPEYLRQLTTPTPDPANMEKKQATSIKPKDEEIGNTVVVVIIGVGSASILVLAIVVAIWNRQKIMEYLTRQPVPADDPDHVDANRVPELNTEGPDSDPVVAV